MEPTAALQETRASEPVADSLGGRQVIFGLFALLFLATTVVLLVFAAASPPEAHRRLFAALALDLALPFQMWFTIRGATERRPGWFYVAFGSASAVWVLFWGALFQQLPPLGTAVLGVGFWAVLQTSLHVMFRMVWIGMGQPVRAARVGWYVGAFATVVVLFAAGGVLVAGLARLADLLAA